MRDDLAVECESETIVYCHMWAWDSLEAIDSERIATLVEYLTDYTGYLLVALLPEDASALPDEYTRITEI